MLDSAQKFDRMLRAMVGEEELAEMKIEQADNHPRFCQCDVCKNQMRLLFVNLLQWKDTEGNL